MCFRSCEAPCGLRLPGTDLREHPERPVFFENNLKQRKETGAVLCVVGCAAFLALPVAPRLMRQRLGGGKEKLSSPALSLSSFVVHSHKYKEKETQK